MKAEAVIALLVAVLIFGCIGGGGGGTTPTPAATNTPAATPTSVATETPAGTQTPAATPTAGMASPTPAGGNLTWEGLFGCARVGITYAYRITTAQGTNEMEYRSSEGGNVGGFDTVLKTNTVSMEGMTITSREWDTKVGCRCVKVESDFGGQTMPGQCPTTGSGGGEAQGAVTTYTTVGIEAVSVPAYTGPATKTHVVSVTSSGTYSSDVWSAPGIAVPVKMVASGVTMELLRYSG